MTSGDEFKVVFESMETAFSNAGKTAAELTQHSEEQTSRMRNMLSGQWTGAVADANTQAYQMQQKRTGEHADATHAEGVAYRQVGEIGQNVLQQAMRIVQS
ncbi:MULTISPECIES: hypothetical protein [Amycolatopsis]|uniref:hypothetical protein n=1 Tax=Amycolatopsis sp. cg13 TaxID=3238807 RepID=UPI0035262C15